MSTALAKPTPPLTPEDVDAMRDGDGLYELVDGKLIKRTMSLQAGRVVMRVGQLLLNHLDEHPLADIVDPETSFRCFPDAPRQLRRADVALILVERLNEDLLTGIVPIAPDLVVEVVSPDDILFEVIRKVGHWRAAGTREVWIIDPGNRLALSFGEGGDRIVHEDDALDGGDVLPGFRRPLADFLKVNGPRAVVPEEPAGGD